LSWRGYLTQLLQTPGARGLLAQILGAAALLQVIGLAFPLVMKVLIDTVLPAQDASLLAMMGIGLVVLALAEVTLSYLRTGLALYLEIRLDIEVLLGFFEQVLTLPFRFFHERNSGDLMMRLGSTAVIRDMVTGQAIGTVLDGAMVAFYAVVLFLWQPLFGVIALLFGALQIWLLLGSTRHLYELSAHDLAAQAESQSYLVEALGGIATLKASASEDRMLEHWSNLFFRQLNIALRRSHLVTLIDTGQGALGALAPIALLWIGGLWVIDGRMTLGAMLAVNTLALSFLGPLSSLVSTVQEMHLVGVHLDRIADVLQTPPEQDPQTVRAAPAL